jgi:hypothetical protein
MTYSPPEYGSQPRCDIATRNDVPGAYNARADAEAVILI